jgi:hypothetical protein
VTEVGELRGRDAVYLERTIQTCAPSALRLEGQLNTRLCTSYSGSREWLPYELEFTKVAAYMCFDLDLYGDEQQIVSSLDIVPNSPWLEQLRLPASIHYVVATYDHVYEVAATGIALRLSSGRQ